MGGNHGNNSIHLAKITTVDNHGDNKMSVRFDWSEDRLRHVYIIEEGDLKYEFTLDYEDNIIKRTFVYDYNEQSGKMLECNYTSGKLLSITSTNFDGINFQYIGNVPSYVTATEKKLALTWLNGNVCRFTSYGEFDLTEIEYDSKYNPFNEISKAFFPTWDKTINNPIRVVSDGKVTDIIYEIIGGYPYIATASNGNRFTKVYYQYTDGSGVKPPTEDKCSFHKRKNRSIIPLPQAIMQ